MVARAIWKGTVRWDNIKVPVKVFSAVQDRSIHFHLLHDQDMVRIKQRMVNPESGETVPLNEAVKAYEIERNLFVQLDADELKSLEPEESRDIEITQFVDADAIGQQWFARPYWLGPDGGDDEQDDYFALAEALADTEKIGLAKWVMRKKQYVGALVPQDNYLLLVTLRTADQVISPTDLGAPAAGKLDPRERKLAEQLIVALEDKFDPEAYEDDYRERVMELIKTKQKGGTVEVEEYEEPPEPKSLAASLRASLARVK